MKLNENNKGFTLIEILVVISIISILFVLFVPQVSSFFEKSKEAGVRTDFRSFQASSEMYLRENTGKNNDLNGLNRYLDTNHFVSEDGVVKQTRSKDSWGNFYQVEIDDKKIIFSSQGKEKDSTLKKYVVASYYQNGVIESCTSGFRTKNISLQKFSNLPDDFTCGENIELDEIPEVVFDSSDPTIRLPLEGTGVCSDPYIITTIGELQGMKLARSSCFELGNDIDASGTFAWNEGKGFEPIGNMSEDFKGKLDGKGHTISSLTINRPTENHVSFLGYSNEISGSYVKNINFEQVSITGKNNVGSVANFGFVFTIENVHVTGDVTGVDNVGGLIASGYMLQSRVYDSSFVGNVKGRNNVGGISGGGIYLVENTYSMGTVEGNENVGGITGLASPYTEYKNIYSGMSVKGISNVGGLVGQYLNNDSSNFLSYAYSFGEVIGTTKTGGLVGNNDVNMSVINSYWDTSSSNQNTSASGSGKTTLEMKTQSTFVGWDFTTKWSIHPSINNGYPYLTSNHPLTH